MLSDNAIPVNMFRINRTTPFKLPSILGWLGPLRLEFFLGQLQRTRIHGRQRPFGTFGHPLRHQPMIHGERFTFKPTRNFEFGFSRTVIFAGEEVPSLCGRLRTACSVLVPRTGARTAGGSGRPAIGIGLVVSGA